MFYVNLRLGGLYRDLPPDFRERSYALSDYLERQIRQYPETLEKNPIFMERTKGIGKLRKLEAINYGVSDLCCVHPESRRMRVIGSVLRVQQGKIQGTDGVNGDNFDRYRVRYEEMLQSIKIIRQALDAMSETGT